MLKKIFSSAGVLTLVIFSFYYTDLAASIIKSNDPIMKEIKKSKSNYEEQSVNAILNNNNIVPGISGVSVDINSSYSRMKKYGSFNDDLMVFNEVVPSISVSNIYDKYITSGNETKSNISLIFIVDNYSYITEIINILDSKNVKATFFINKDIIKDSDDLIKFINNSKHEVELYSKEYTIEEIKKTNKLIRKYIDKDLNFCYTEKDSPIILENCSKIKLHTIIPSIITNDYPYSDIKTNLKNGSIIKLDNNEEVLRELKYILNYINQKGFKMTTLIDLLKE